jgi:hypothetical protein
MLYYFILHCEEYFSSTDIASLPDTFRQHIVNITKHKLREEHIDRTITALHTSSNSRESANKKVPEQQPSTTSTKKTIPEDVIQFAYQISCKTPKAISEHINKYIIRLYRNNKPIITKQFKNEFGLDDETIKSICDIGLQIGFTVNYDLSTDEDIHLGEHIIHENTPITSDTICVLDSNKDTSQEVIPETAEQIISIFKKHGYNIYNEKHLLKECQAILIE